MLDDELILSGQVVSGRGKAATGLQKHINEVRHITGEKIVAGSLNLLLKVPLRLCEHNAFKFGDDKRLLWPASVNGKAVWIFRWRHAPLHVAEILSSAHLRSTLALNDGSWVRIHIRREMATDLPNLDRLAWTLVWWCRRSWCYTNDEYYFKTRDWCMSYGATQLDAKKSFRHLAWAAMKGGVKKIPGSVKLVNHFRRMSRDHPGKQDLYEFKRIRTVADDNGSALESMQIQNLLNYTKTSGSSYAGKKYAAGYHSLEIKGQFYSGQRNPAERFKRMPVDFNNKSVLDIGCNQGGMLFELDEKLKWGVGVDYDYRVINAANRIKSINNSTVLDFYVFDLQNEELDLIADLIPESNVDIVLLLSVCKWLDNWQQIIRFCATISNLMIYESTGTNDEQAAQIQYLRELYSDVQLLSDTSDDDPGHKRRKLFMCENVA